jgi:hypothetical protein
MTGIIEIVGITRDCCQWRMHLLVCQFAGWYEVFRSFHPIPGRNW